MLREESVDVVVVDESGRLPGLVEDDGVVDLEGRFSGVRIRRPLEVAERAAVGAVMTAVVGPGDEGLARAVGYEERDTARPRVREGGAHARAQVVLGREVHHGVVHEDDVERAAEPERPHVTEHVLAVGVERPAQREHLRREVGERAREALPQVRGVVAATRAELEERHGLGKLLEDRVPVASGLDLVVGGRRQQVEPVGEVAVEAHEGIIARG